MSYRLSHPYSQRGQAIAEALVAMIAIIALWQAVAWLARIQDLALNASHAARYGAFAASRNPALLDAEHVDMRFLTAQRLQWVDRRGRWLLSQIYQEPSLHIQRGEALPNDAQPGQSHADSKALRSEWKLADLGVVMARLRLQPLQPSGPWPQLRRQLAIAVDAGHASSDTDTVQRLRQSSRGWADTVNNSVGLGRQVESSARGVDAAWSRSLPDYDWLMPWAADVPSHVISPAIP